MIRHVLVAAMLAAFLVPAGQADPVPDGCSPKTVSSGTSPEHIVTTHADCSVDVELNKGIICVGAWSATDERDVGPVHVTHHRCTFPGGDPIPPISLTTAGPCGQTESLGVATIHVWGDCSVRVDIKLYDCIWGGYWHQHTPPPAEVREYRCGAPPA